MTADDINQFFSFLYQGQFGEAVFWLRLISGVITSALVAAIVVIAIKFRQMNMYSPARRIAPLVLLPEKEIVVKPWAEVLKKIQSPNPSDWNLAVIQADSIFDAVTKDMSLPGETLGDRLKSLDPSKLNSLNDVWEAHKIRNRIAHETERILTHDEAMRVIGLFEKALRELQYLQD